MKVAFVAILAASIPLCLFAIVCVFYRLYCKRDRKKDAVLLGQGRKLWRKSYELAGSSPESLAIPKHAPKIVSKFVQDSPQLSSASTSTVQMSPLDDSLCLTGEDEDDDNSSLSNYKTAPDELFSSPGNASVEPWEMTELISLAPSSEGTPKDIETVGVGTAEESVGGGVAGLPRKIPSIRVVNESEDVLFKLEVSGTHLMQTDKVSRRDEKIPINLSQSVIQRNRNVRYTSTATGLGKLSVSILYKQSTCELFLKVNKASDLPVKDLRNNTTSPFIRLYVLPSRRYNYSTQTITKSVNPVFNECFVIGGLTLMEILQLTIQFLVIHHESVQRNIIVGELILPLVKYEVVDEEITICENIKAYKPEPVLGELQISVCHQPLANKLSLTVVQAKNLPKISNYGIGDPYVKVELFFNNRRVCKKKSRSKKRTTNPRFVQTFTFDLESSNVLLDTVTIVMTVFVKDPGGCHEKVGQVVLSSLADGAASTQWNEVIANPHCPIERWQMIYE